MGQSFPSFSADYFEVSFPVLWYAEPILSSDWLKPDLIFSVFFSRNNGHRYSVSKHHRDQNNNTIASLAAQSSPNQGISNRFIFGDLTDFQHFWSRSMCCLLCLRGTFRALMELLIMEILVI